jgi:exonuclease SbcC
MFLDAVNSELSDMVREVMHKGSYVEVRLSGEYEVYVKRSDGVELSVDSLSIGERNIVALLLRYSIARSLLGNIPILLLDEPTEHLDDEHRRRIASWVRSLSNGVNTVLITSHVDILETVADNVVRMSFMNDKGESMFSNT